MKIIAVVFLIFSFLYFKTYSQSVYLNSNLKNEFSRLKSKYFSPAPPFSEWKESQGLLLISETSNPINSETIFMALKDSTLIGVYKNKEKPYFIFDSKGNSILDNKTEHFILPSWIVKKTSKIKSNDRKILDILDKLYEQTLQADNGTPNEQTILEFNNYKINDYLPNRHIALLFDTYQTLIANSYNEKKTPPADLCISIMKELSGSCLELYGIVPAIICVYMGEALVSAGMKKEARDHFKLSLEFYPNSIPIMVYNYRLEDDYLKKKELLTQLKNKYSSHWMVKDL